MLTIDSIRYMGNKSKLLSFIIPEIRRATPENGIVCDLMAGSNAVSYALKEFFTVYTNDVQAYSKVISDAVVVNQSQNISPEAAQADLLENYLKNKSEKEYSFFEDTYSDTYFSKEQCADIDSLRFAIEQLCTCGSSSELQSRRSLYLLALMNAMCAVQSTPGHFAQYMPGSHKRIIPLQQMDLFQEFIKKCALYSDIFFTGKDNRSFCMDYRELFKTGQLDLVDTVYLDSPYSQEQYSRFYHILETVVKYDRPEVFFKAKYRPDRFMSGFCYKDRVEDEFRTVLDFCRTGLKNLVISYSDHGVMPADRLLTLCQDFFSDVSFREISYNHSTQGKGTTKIEEIILTCIN